MLCFNQMQFGYSTFVNQLISHQRLTFIKKSKLILLQIQTKVKVLTCQQQEFVQLLAAASTNWAVNMMPMCLI